MGNALNKLLSACLLCFACCTVQAMHFSGAQIYYRNISGLTYEVTVKFYRDCTGIQAPDSIQLNFSSTCNPGGMIFIHPDPGFPVSVPLECPTALSTCSGGTYYGIEEYSYSGNITFPLPCRDWVMSFEECCRSATITTIDSSFSYDAHVYATLNNFDVTYNSSPVYLQPPVTRVCQGQQVCLQQYVSEPDGDSLAFSLVSPEYGPSGIPVNYLAGYSYLQPFSTQAPLSMDPGTGELCFTPTASEVTAYAIEVKEFRNGILTGTTESEVLLYISTCNNSMPSISGTNGTGLYTAMAVPGMTNCFSFYASDPDSSDQTTLTLESSLPGSYFSAHHSYPDTGDFCWNPQPGDTIGNPHRIIVRVTDNNCPYTASRSYNFYFTVTGNVSAGTLSMQPVNLYPNPSSGFFRFQSAGQVHFSSVRISDVSGREIQQFHSVTSGMLLSVQELADGMYFIRADDEEGLSHTFRLMVIQRSQ